MARENESVSGGRFSKVKTLLTKSLIGFIMKNSARKGNCLLALSLSLSLSLSRDELVFPRLELKIQNSKIQKFNKIFKDLCCTKVTCKRRVGFWQRVNCRADQPVFLRGTVAMVTGVLL